MPIAQSTSRFSARTCATVAAVESISAITMNAHRTYLPGAIDAGLLDRKPSRHAV